MFFISRKSFNKAVQSELLRTLEGNKKPEPDKRRRICAADIMYEALTSKPQSVPSIVRIVKRHFPKVKRESVSTQLAEMHRAGKIQRHKRGHYCK